MIFEKPEDVRYTDMAIWIDSNVYSDSCDELTLYKYIYLLVEMLSRKKHFFEKETYYEDFSIYASNYFFKRVKPSDRKQRKNIKSILNYIKSSLFGLKKNFEKKNFSQLTPQEDLPYVDRINTIDTYRSTQDFIFCEYTLSIEGLPKCVWETCKRTPYATNGNILRNIYTSTLLTLLNQITLPQKVVKELSEDAGRSYMAVDLKRLSATKEPLDDVILFHLPNSMKNYILFLANRSKKTIARDLSQIIQSWEPSDDLIDSLLKDQVDSYLGEYKNED